MIRNARSRTRQNGDEGKSQNPWLGFERLKWLTAIVPALAVFTFESVRHSLVEDMLPTAYGNVLVGLVALVLSYAFAEIVFRNVRRVHAQAQADKEESATLNAVIQERERLSRELHDGLAQLVAYLSVRLDTVMQLIQSGKNDEAVAELERLRVAADELHIDIRESISGLRSRVTERGLAAALHDYSEEFEERNGITVTCNAEDRSRSLSALTELQLFRIVQEALTNIRKHAHAREASISLQAAGTGTVELVVADDGVGFEYASLPVANGGALGLASMRERAQSVGGSLHVQSEPGRGTRVVVRLPMAPARS
jgi:signal transduction histidine kinase